MVLVQPPNAPVSQTGNLTPSIFISLTLELQLFGPAAFSWLFGCVVPVGSPFTVGCKRRGTGWTSMFSTLAWQALVLSAMRLSSRLRRPGSADIYPLRLVLQCLALLLAGREIR